MKKAEKIALIRRLVAKGETLCARVMCDDWNLDFNEVINESKSKKSR